MGDHIPHQNTTTADAAPERPELAPRRRQDQLADWLAARIDDIEEARTSGWDAAATWIKAVIASGAAAGIILIIWLFIKTIAWLVDWSQPEAPDLPDVPRGTGLVATITDPVHHYLDVHTTGLPVSADTAYTAWSLTGLAAVVTGWLTGATGARLTWLAWGAATVAMVWAATPEPGRTVAAGVAVLGWTAASTLALRGLSLRAIHITHTR